jgi:hypothetical protein
MTPDDDLELLVLERAKALIGPIQEVMEHAVQLLERLTDRVEVLELEVLHRQRTPNTPPGGNTGVP